MLLCSMQPVPYFFISIVFILMPYGNILQFRLNQDFLGSLVRRCGSHRYLLLSNLDSMGMGYVVYW